MVTRARRLLKLGTYQLPGDFQMDHALTPRIAFRLLRKVNLAESKAFQALLNPPASLKKMALRR